MLHIYIEYQLYQWFHPSPVGHNRQPFRGGGHLQRVDGRRAEHPHHRQSHESSGASHDGIRTRKEENGAR